MRIPDGSWRLTAIAVDAQGSASPIDAETIDRLEYGAPLLFMRLKAIEEEGDGNTLSRLYGLCAETPKRLGTSATENPRSAISRPLHD